MNNLKNLKRQKPSVDLNDYRYTFYGKAGSGKSSTAFYFFDDPLFFAWEKGQKTLAARVWECYSWKDMIDFCKQARKLYKSGELEENDLKNTVVIMDTADIMRDAAEVYVCTQNGWDSPSDGEWGAGFATVRHEFEYRVNELESMGFKVNFIAHDKLQEVTRADGVKFDKATLFLGSTATNQVIKKADIIMYFDYEYEKDKNGEPIKRRVIRFGGGDVYEAKSRIKDLPEFVYSKDSPEATAQMLRELFTEKLQEMSDRAVEEAEKSKKNFVDIMDDLDLEKFDEIHENEEESDDAISKEESEELIQYANSLYTQKKLSAKDISEIVNNHSSVERIGDVENREEYEAVFSALKNI